MMHQPSIIIIGAGAAGLMAATELASHFKVTILEAMPQTGGRIHSIRHHKSIIEAGAEFVHGNLPVTLGLLKKAGLSYVETKGVMYRNNSRHLTPVEEMTEGWDGFMDKMKNLKEDCTIQQLLEKYYASPEYSQLRKQVKSYASGFDLADISKASAKALYKEWSAEEEKNYRIPAGYGTLIDYLHQQAVSANVIIHTNALVKSVHWQTGNIKLKTSVGQEYGADKLLVTVPISVLQQPFSKATIDFMPALHLAKNKAAEIGFGAVIKVVLQFNNAFWPKDAGFIFSDELFPTWWAQLPNKVPQLTGWVGGPAASAMSDGTEEHLLNKALLSLAAIFNQDISTLKEALVQSWVFNWQKNEFCLGGYSYATLHSETAKAILNTPIQGTIFFAGEALYTGEHPGTVEAALVSGSSIATVIKNTIDN